MNPAANLGNSIQLPSELSHPRSEGAGAFILQVWSVPSSHFAVVRQSKPPVARACLRAEAGVGIRKLGHALAAWGLRGCGQSAREAQLVHPVFLEHRLCDGRWGGVCRCLFCKRTPRFIETKPETQVSRMPGPHCLPDMTGVCVKVRADCKAGLEAGRRGSPTPVEMDWHVLWLWHAPVSGRLLHQDM